MQPKTTQLSTWLFFYSLNYLFWHIGIIYFTQDIAGGLLLADVLDIATPFVMVFLSVGLFLRAGSAVRGNVKITRRPGPFLLLLLGCVAFVEGHGMHLSSNAIARYLSPQPWTPVYGLTYFFDERLGHIFWDSGMILISIAVLLAAGAEDRVEAGATFRAASAAVYGFTYFCNSVEGQTVAFAFPVAILIAGGLLRIYGRNLLRGRPIAGYYFVAYATASLLLAGWGLANQGFPEFSALGWI